MKKMVLVLLAAVMVTACKKESSTVQSANSDPTASRKKAVNATVSFAGYTWQINAPSGLVSPGPNYWSGSNAWVDANGWLHLKVAKNPSNNHWESAEVYTTQSLGYGTYQWQVEGALGSFDKNIVLGLYNYSGNDQHDEMDIEIARWGNAAWDNLNYTIWPATGVTGSPGSYTASFTTPNGTYTTHRFKRTSTSVYLQSLYGFQDGDANQFQSKTFSTTGTSPISISTLAMPVHMNLWLFDGNAPSDGQPVEVIIHSFKFTPL
jgi:hypothetical protein